MLLHFDPALLAIPNHASTQDEAEQIVHRIRYWARSCFFSSLFQGAVLGDTITILADGDFFPSTPNIVDLLDQWGLRHVYSTEDVRRAVNFILERAVILEDIFDVEVTSAQFCESAPDLTARVRLPLLFDATVRHLTTLTLAVCVNPEEVSRPVVVSGFANTTGDVDLKLTANDGVVLRRPDEFNFPLSARSNLIFADNVEDVAGCLGAKALWCEADTPEQLHFALMVEATHLLRAKGVFHRTEDVPKFRIGSDFFETATRFNATGMTGASGDLLREACARIVVNDPKYPVGELKRANKFGKLVPVIRKRDGAIACRTHLQKSHAALRLMFWRLHDGSMEFANVGPKAELEILDGSDEATDRHDCWSQEE